MKNYIKKLLLILIFIPILSLALSQHVPVSQEENNDFEPIGSIVLVTINDTVETNDTTPTFSGTSFSVDRNITITVGSATYSVTPANDGIWTLNTQTATSSSGTFILNDGTHTITADAQDSDGNVIATVSDDFIINTNTDDSANNEDLGAETVPDAEVVSDGNTSKEDLGAEVVSDGGSISNDTQNNGDLGAETVPDAEVVSDGGSISNDTQNNGDLSAETVPDAEIVSDGDSISNETSTESNVTSNLRVIMNSNISNNTTLDGYNESNALTINFAQEQLYVFNPETYYNYILNTNKYIIDVYEFNSTSEGIISNFTISDFNNTAIEYNTYNEYFKTSNDIVSVYSNSDFTNKLYEFKYIHEYTSLKDNESNDFNFTNPLSKAYVIHKKYDMNSLELYENYLYNNEKVSSLEQVKQKIISDTSSNGVLRSTINSSNMLFVMSNNTLVEKDIHGNTITQADGTSQAGTWEEISVSKYKYKDENNIWKYLTSSSNAILLHPSIDAYPRNIAIATGQDSFIKIAKYYKKDEISELLYYNNSAMKEMYQTFSTNTKMKVHLNEGWNYTSLRTSMTLCDSSIQTELENICNQNYSLNNIFSNSKIKYILRNVNSNWSYWDTNSTINSYYALNKFLAIEHRDGLFIKANSSVDIYLPYNIFDNIKTSSFNIQSKSWKLLALNTPKTSLEIKTMVEAQNKILKYILVFRNNEWLIYSPTEDKLISSDTVRLNQVLKYETFWIFTE